MHRRLRSIRRFFWIFGALLVMLAALLVGALVATTPHLLSGSQSARAGATKLIDDPIAAATDFQSASRSFNASLAGLRSLPEPAQFPALVPPFSWYIRLNKAAIYLGRAGEDAARLAASYPKTNAGNEPAALLTAHSGAIGSLLESDSNTFDSLVRNLELADNELQKVPSWIFLNKSGELKNLKTDVHTLRVGLPKTLDFAVALREALGANDTKTHTALIIFQNDNELRPSGGFMGSYSVATASSGVVRSFELGTDIYKLDWILEHRELIPTPPELKTIAPWWGFRDSNIGEGFLPVLGPQIAEFYAKATDVNPDLILFVDLTVLENLLALTGPVTLPGTTTEVTADSVSTELTTFVEKEYWNLEGSQEVRAPKTVIGDLIPTLLRQVRENREAIRDIPSLVSRAAARKSLQLWSASPSLTKASTVIFPSDLPEGEDWMKIVNSNIGGKKSSRNVSQQVTISNKKRDGFEERTVTIKRTHNGDGVWPDDENRNYMEIFLPPDAEIITKPEGKGGENLLPDWKQEELGVLGSVWPGEVKREENWVRVGFWATTTVAEQTEFVLKYRIPATADPFVYVKQAGTQNEDLKAFGFKGEVAGNVRLEKKHFLW